MSAMRATTAAKPPRPMRLNRPKAELVPVAQFARWHELASATPGLSGLELALLSAIAGYHRQLQEKGDTGSLSLLRLAEANRTEPIYVSTAVKNLISLGLIAVLPGRGNWASTYLPALPKRVVASMLAAPQMMRRRRRSDGGRLDCDRQDLCGHSQQRYARACNAILRRTRTRTHVVKNRR
jgi:hypothetical protein